MLPHRTVLRRRAHISCAKRCGALRRRRSQPHFQRWEEAGIVDRSLWSCRRHSRSALRRRFPKQFGGVGGDFRHNAVVIEELSYSRLRRSGNRLLRRTTTCAADICSAMATAEQTKKWLPRMVSGETVLRDRDDRTRHRKRPAGHPHPRRVRGRRVCDIGPEDLHLERTDVRSRDRGGSDHAGGRLAGHESGSGRDRPARFPPRPKPRKAGASLLRYRRNCFSMRCASPSATCWERKGARWAR